jgi:exonuclease III
MYFAWTERRALAGPMKIASFNINNIRKRLPNLLEWLKESAPDIVCLQELKTADAEFPDKAIRDAGYEAVWRGQKTWNGVAILTRWTPTRGSPVIQVTYRAATSRRR